MVTRQSIFFFLLIIVASLACEKHVKRPKKIVFPISIMLVEGDDGLDSNTMQIISNGNHFSAIEIATDNFSHPKHIDTLLVDNLNPQQLDYLDTFLLAFDELPDNCQTSGSFFQALTVSQIDFKRSVEGRCEWGKASYNSLRRVLFEKSLY